MTLAKPDNQHHHGNLRDAVIAFAVDAARDGTIETLSLRSVSRELGVSSGAVYRHFDDKNALLRDVAKTGLDILAGRFEAAMPFDSQAHSADEAKARFVALANAYVSLSNDSYGLWRLMFGPHGRANSSPANDRPSTYQWLTKSLHELHATGLIRRPDAEMQFFAWSALHGLADLNASPARDPGAINKSVAAQCDLIVAAFRET